MTVDEMNLWLIENEKLIHSFCHKFYKGRITRLIEYEDFFQVASYGAWKGLKNFDGNKGIKLTTYVGTCIENELRMEIRKYGTQTRQYDNNISFEETISTDKGDELTVESMLGEQDTCLTNKIDIMLLNKILDNIIQKDAKPEQLAFIMDKYLKGYTQREIAEELNVSQSLVSKIIRRTKKKLKRVGGFQDDRSNL